MIATVAPRNLEGARHFLSAERGASDRFAATGDKFCVTSRNRLAAVRRDSYRCDEVITRTCTGFKSNECDDRNPKQNTGLSENFPMFLGSFAS